MTTYQVATGLHLGVPGRVYEGEFDAVVEVGQVPRARVDPAVPYLFVAVPHGLNDVVVRTAVAWLEPRWLAKRQVLVMSAGTLHAQKIAVALFIHLGASADEATAALRRADPPLPVRDPSAFKALRGAP